MNTLTSRWAATAALTVAVISSSGIAAPATATATPVINATPAAVIVDHSTATGARLPERLSRLIPGRHIKKYNLKKRHLREIRKSQKWAKTPKAKSVRWCESNGRYKINTGNGYYGAWQFNYQTWLGSGGGRYESHAHKAPKFAQDHIAWKLWKMRGWQPWTCA